MRHAMVGAVLLAVAGCGGSRVAEAPRFAPPPQLEVTPLRASSQATHPVAVRLAIVEDAAGADTAATARVLATDDAPTRVLCASPDVVLRADSRVAFALVPARRAYLGDYSFAGPAPDPVVRVVNDSMRVACTFAIEGDGVVVSDVAGSVRSYAGTRCSSFRHERVVGAARRALPYPVEEPVVRADAGGAATAVRLSARESLLVPLTMTTERLTADAVRGLGVALEPLAGDDAAAPSPTATGGRRWLLISVDAAPRDG